MDVFISLNCRFKMSSIFGVTKYMTISFDTYRTFPCANIFVLDFGRIWRLQIELSIVSQIYVVNISTYIKAKLIIIFVEVYSQR